MEGQLGVSEDSETVAVWVGFVGHLCAIVEGEEEKCFPDKENGEQGEAGSDKKSGACCCLLM